MGKHLSKIQNPSPAKIAIGVGATAIAATVGYLVYDKLTEKKPSASVPKGSCGARYADLIQASDGRTPDAPYSSVIPGAPLWCNEPDAQAWYAQATHIFKLQRAAWNELIGVENETGDHERSRKISPSATAYENAYFALDDPDFYMVFSAGGCAEAIDAYIANMRMGVCVLDRLNQALEDLGSGTIDPGFVGKPGSWVPWAVAGAAVTAIGVGGYVGYQKYKKVKRLGNPRHRRKRRPKAS